MMNAFLSHTEAALRNRNTVLNYVKDNGPISRTDIWENLSISRASVTQVIKQLQEANLIVETGEGESTGGRKPRFLQFNGEARVLYAFDWTSKTLCLMDLSGKIWTQRTLDFPIPVTPASFAQIINEAIHEMDAAHSIPKDMLLGFGMALPGILDSARRRVSISVELGWQNVSISSLFADRFEDAVFLERTGNAMALGAHTLMEGQISDHFQLFILSDKGIGVSTIIHGKCQHGANNMHGELGHIKTLENVVCSCGGKGCLEAVVNQILLQNGGKITEQLLEYLSIGVSTGLNISDPDTAILVGSLVERMTQKQRDMLSDSIRAKLSGAYIRNIEIRFVHDMKQLALTGICSHVFDCCFPMD